MKQTITGHLFMEHGYAFEEDDYAQRWRPIVWHCRVDENESRVFVKDVTFDIDVPQDFDPTPRQVAALEREREQATAAYMKTLHDINERLSKLQAIGHDAPAETLDEF